MAALLLPKMAARRSAHCGTMPSASALSLHQADFTAAKEYLGVLVTDWTFTTQLQNRNPFRARIILRPSPRNLILGDG
eukprot:802123-Rhodomonas_salina.2